MRSNTRNIGIVGEGKMGTGIFYYLLDFDYHLVWVCSTGADTDLLARQLGRRMRRAADAGIISREQYEIRQKTVITTDLNALSGCDLVIEAIPENLELKRGLFIQLDGIVKQEAIFVSNSSSINPSAMAPAGLRGTRFAGIHFFYPVALKNIAELTIPPQTTSETISATGLFLNDIKKRYITLNEQNSFLLNRIFLDLQNEAFLLVQAGHCTYRQMDQLVKKHLNMFGIFDFCDSVGLDTMRSSILNYTASYPHKNYYALLISKLTDLVSQGHLGMKTQEGFYKYPLDESPVEEPAIVSEIVDHLRQTWLSSSKRFTAQAHIPIDEANFAIREYFDLPKGPFE